MYPSVAGKSPNHPGRGGHLGLGPWGCIQLSHLMQHVFHQRVYILLTSLRKLRCAGKIVARCQVVKDRMDVKLKVYRGISRYNQHKHGAFGNRNLPSASNPGGKEVQSHLRRPSRQFIEPHVKVILGNWQTWQSATVRNSTIHRSWQPPIPAFWGSANHPKGVISNDKPMIYARIFLGHVC